MQKEKPKEEQKRLPTIQTLYDLCIYHWMNVPMIHRFLEYKYKWRKE